MAVGDEYVKILSAGDLTESVSALDLGRGGRYNCCWRTLSLRKSITEVQVGGLVT